MTSAYEVARLSLEKAGLFIDDLPDIRLEEIFITASRAVDHFGIRMVIINHADFISVRGGSYFGPSDADEVVKELKLLARSRNIPVVLLAPVGELHGASPCLSALGRYSNASRSYADAIVFLKDADGTRPGEVDASIIRQRGGAGGWFAWPMSSISTGSRIWWFRRVPGGAMGFCSHSRRFGTSFWGWLLWLRDGAAWPGD